MRGYSPGKSMVGVAGFEPTTSSSRNRGRPVSRSQMRRIAVVTRRPRAALAVLVAVLRCCTRASGDGDVSPALLGGLAGDAEPGRDLSPGVADAAQSGNGG